MVTLQQLIYFRELAKTGHLTRTAERMHITQTTLSNTIINLEKQLEVKLFDRVGRTLRLNEAGALYFKHVNEALICLDNAQIAVNDFKEGHRQSVSVAMTSSNVWSILIHSFRTRYPSYTIRQIGCSSTLFRSMLMDQELDFVIAGVDDFSLSGLKHQVIREETLYLCVPPSHPLAGRSSVHLSELRDEPFIDLQPTSAFQLFCNNLFEQAGFTHHTALECDYTLRGKLVEAGFGAAITTHSSLTQNLLGSSNTYIPIADTFARRPIAIIWNPRRYLSRAALDFRDWALASEGTPPSP